MISEVGEVGEVFQSDLLFVKFYFGEITIQIIYQTNCAVNIKKKVFKAVITSLGHS